MNWWKAPQLVLTGAAIDFLGVFLNWVTMHENGGRMPVFMYGCWDGLTLDARHVCASGWTKLAGFADWIDIGKYIYSPGDFLLFFGQWLCVAALAVLTWQILILRIRNRK